MIMMMMSSVVITVNEVVILLPKIAANNFPTTMVISKAVKIMTFFSVPDQVLPSRSIFRATKTNINIQEEYSQLL